MSNYTYDEISEISFCSSSSGMSIDSSKSVTEKVIWQPDGTVILQRTDINGFIKEVSTWNLSAEQAEEIRAAAEKTDMASWRGLRIEEDPRSFCYDYSSSAGGKISLHYTVRGVRLFVELGFDRSAVIAAGKGEDLKMMEGLLERIEDHDKRANYEKTDRLDMFFFKKPANYEKTYTEGASMWTCKCGTINYGKFCTECGSRRP